MQINKEEYKQEKASRENRLDEFNECVKKKISELSRNIISELVEEREKTLGKDLVKYRYRTMQEMNIPIT